MTWKRPKEALRVTVLGADGLIGRALTSCLESRGHDVTGADIVGGPATAQADVRDFESLTSLFAQTSADVICNLAYLLGDASETRIRDALDVNVAGFANVLEAAARTPSVRRVVYSSSIAVYGDQAAYGTDTATEATHGKPEQLYGWMKQLNEAVAAAYSRSSAFSAVGLRISTVFGLDRKGGSSAVFSDLLRAAAVGERFVCTVPSDHEVALIHVDDVAQSMAVLVDAPTARWPIYNSGGELVTMGEFVDMVHEEAPQASIVFKDAGRHPMRHVSRVNWSRLREEFGGDRPSVRDWVRREMQRAHSSFR